MTLDTLARLYAERDALEASIAVAEAEVTASIKAAQTKRIHGPRGADIIHAVSAHCDVPPSFLTDRAKTAALVEARALAYMVARLNGWTYTEIAKWAGRDHSTIISAENRWNETLANDATWIQDTLTKAAA